MNVLSNHSAQLVIDMGKNVVTYQVTGNPEKIDAFIDLLRPYGIKELTRTGATAFVRETQKVTSTTAFQLLKYKIDKNILGGN